MKATLGDVVEFTNGGAWNQTEYAEAGVPVVRVSDIHDETVQLDECKFLPETRIEKYRKHLLREGDVIVATVGSHPTQPGSVVGRMAKVPKTADGTLLNQNAVRLAPLDDKIDRLYLRYLAATQNFRNYLISHARESANQVRIAISSMRIMPITLPPMPVQRRVASILASYDDLIENNARRVKILEQMAQMTYREWFVNFRFPGHEKTKTVESEKGMIPEGWCVKRLFDLADVTYCFPFKSKLFNESRIGKAVIRIRDIKSSSTRTFTSESADPKYIVKNGDLLVGMDGDFHMGKWSGDEAYLNQRVVRFRPKTGFPSYFLFFALQAPIKHFDSTVVGTTVAHLSDRDLRSISITVPDARTLDCVSSFMSPCFDLEIALSLQNTNLRQTRDLLLFKLTSDEINVREAEREAVAQGV